MSDDVFVLDPKDAGRLWLRDIIHTPRALPPLPGDLFAELSAHQPMGLDYISIRGYAYGSPRSMSTPTAPPPLPPGEALKNWESRYLPQTQRMYERFRDADYDAMESAEIIAFFKALVTPTAEAFADTIVSAMEASPDAERLAVLLDGKLGPEGELLSARILHGSESQTRSLGTEVQGLAEAARRTPGVETALLERDFAVVAASDAEPWASVLASFLKEHEDEIALWSEIHEPAWNEDPTPLLKLVAATLAASGQERTNNGADAIATVRSKLKPEDVTEFEAALALSRDYVPIIEHRARWQLKLFGGVRRLFVALGEKLVAMGVADAPADVFFLRYSELEPAARGEIDLRAIVPGRRAEWQENLKLAPPMTLGLPITYEMVGMASPMLRRVFGAVAVNPATATVVSGIAANAGVVRGRARVVGGLAEAEDLVPGDILVCPSTSPPWTPYFAVVSAVVTDAGGVLSHAAIEAREYGIPAVVGTREGTRRIPEGAMITVDGSAGTVTIEG
ncbi:MAG: PEP-utilizing enzyme [Dehalococcoidia bacterium]